MRDYVRRFALQKFGDPGNAVANNVVQEFSWQSPNPVPFVAKKCSCILRPANLVAVITFHMDWPGTEKASLDESAHTSCGVPELIVVACGYLEPIFTGNGYQLSRFRLIQCKRL